MSVRIRKTGNTSFIADHNDLLNKGETPHSELDKIYREVEEGRGTHVNLDTRFTEVETLADSNKTKVDSHEPRIKTNEDTLTNYGIRIEDNEEDITNLEGRMETAEEGITTNTTTLSNLQDEVEEARGTETSLDLRLDGIEESIEKSQTFADLLIDSAVYDISTNSVKATIVGGDARIEGVVIQQHAKSYTIPDVTANTRYFIFLKQDGTYYHKADDIVEDKGAMLIGSINVGAVLDSVNITDLRYFLTKDSAGELKSRVSSLEESMTQAQTDIGSNTTYITQVEEDKDLIKQEVINSRTDGGTGVVYDGLKDRLDYMMSRIETNSGKGAPEQDSIFHFHSPKDTRLTPQKDFEIPKYFPGANMLDVYVDGIRFDLGDGYIEYTDTIIRFDEEMPIEASITIMSRGSIVTTRQTTSYEYNADGTIKREVISGGIDRTIDYEYDPATGNKTKEIITESNGQVKYIDYTYNADGTLDSVVNDGGMYFVLQGGATYDDLPIKERLNKIEMMGDYNVTYTYDSTEDNIKTEEIYTTDATPQLLKKTEFIYDTVGNVKTERVSQNGRTVEKTYYYSTKGNIKSVEVREV